MQASMPALRPLTLLLKYFLSCRLLNDTYSGGIGSFMLQMMIISHLQHHVSRAHGAHLNLGTLAWSFFEMYGKNFNYGEVGISVRGLGSYFSKHARNWYKEDR